MNDPALDQLIHQLATVGMPRWWVTLAIMAVIPVVVAALRGLRSSHASEGPGGVEPVSDATQLPPDLRTVRVLWRSYQVEARLGRVLDVAPSTFRMIGLDGREGTVKLVNTGFEARPGQLVSVLLRRMPGSEYDCLFAYGNESGQWIDFQSRPIRRAHQESALLPWLLATVAGTLGGVLGLMAAFIAFANGRFPVAMVDGSTWLIAFLASALIARILVPLIGALIMGIRNGQFRNRYMGRYKEFFERATPELVKRLGGEIGPAETGRAATSGG